MSNPFADSPGFGVTPLPKGLGVGGGGMNVGMAGVGSQPTLGPKPADENKSLDALDSNLGDLVGGMMTSAKAKA